MPIIDLESNVSIKELLEDSRNGKVDIDPNPYFQRYALNTSLTLNYGIRIDGKIDNELLKEIVYVERAVSNLRSTSNNWQDYLPILRLWPSKDSKAAQYRERRDKYLTLLLDKLVEQIERGEDKPCITGNVSWLLIVTKLYNFSGIANNGMLTITDIERSRSKIE